MIPADQVAEEVFDVAEDLLLKSARVFRLQRNSRKRPLIGASFSAGEYAMASVAYVRAGLDAVQYTVIHTETGAMVGVGESQTEALRSARTVIDKIGHLRLRVMYGRIAAAIAADEKAERAAREQQAAAWAESRQEEARASVKSIPRRRRQIFEASEGKCHYCGTVLDLSGRWHIEHKMPRALLGGSEQHNLVAACVPCNVKKRDRTDLEFQSALAGSAA